MDTFGQAAEEMKKIFPSAPAIISKGDYVSKKAWGLLASIDLYECDPKLIKSPKAIKKFVIELCEVIKMKRHGDPLIERFAEGLLEGYSMIQFIETSSITAHFDEEKKQGVRRHFQLQVF